MERPLAPIGNDGSFRAEIFRVGRSRALYLNLTNDFFSGGHGLGVNQVFVFYSPRSGHIKK